MEQKEILEKVGLSQAENVSEVTNDWKYLAEALERIAQSCYLSSLPEKLDIVYISGGVLHEHFHPGEDFRRERTSNHIEELVIMAGVHEPPPLYHGILPIVMCSPGKLKNMASQKEYYHRFRPEVLPTRNMPFVAITTGKYRKDQHDFGEDAPAFEFRQFNRPGEIPDVCKNIVGAKSSIYAIKGVLPKLPKITTL